MNCRDVLRFVDAYVDLELDVASALQVEEHLKACPRCRAFEANTRLLQRAVRRHTELYAAPPALRARLQAKRTDGKAAPASWTGRGLAFAFSGFAVLAVATWIGLAQTDRPRQVAGSEPAKFVYHVTHSSTASAAMRTLRNHLEASPDVKVVVVAHNEGIDFLLRGARDESGQLYETLIRRFADRGVDFRVCNNTLVRRDIDSSHIVPEATLVPSGIAEIGRLQAKEGYAYMRL